VKISSVQNKEEQHVLKCRGVKIMILFIGMYLESFPLTLRLIFVHYFFVHNLFLSNLLISTD